MRLPHKTTFDTSWDMLECHELPRLPRKTTLQPASTRKGFAASPIDTATAPQKPATRDETYWSIKTQRQSRRFPRSFLLGLPQNRLPSIFITCHEMPPCHGLCTLPHFAQHWQCDSQKTRNTTRLMTLEVSNVLRLPRKMQRIFWKRSKTIAPPTHEAMFETCCNMWECHEVPRLPREMKLCDAGKLQKGPLLQNLP